MATYFAIAVRLFIFSMDKVIKYMHRYHKKKKYARKQFEHYKDFMKHMVKIIMLVLKWVKLILSKFTLIEFHLNDFQSKN